MPTIRSIIADLEMELADNEAKENDRRSAIESIVSRAERDKRTHLSVAEDKRSEALFADIERIRSANRRINAKLDRARAVEREDAEADAAMRESRSTGVYDNRERKTATVSVTRNERQYHRGVDEQAGF